MIDNFALGLAHLLIACAVWRMVMRMDIDTDRECGAVEDIAGDRGDA